MKLLISTLIVLVSLSAHSKEWLKRGQYEFVKGDWKSLDCKVRYSGLGKKKLLIRFKGEKSWSTFECDKKTKTCENFFGSVIRWDEPTAFYWEASDGKVWYWERKKKVLDVETVDGVEVRKDHMFPPIKSAE